jgi:hypothetical protein
MKSPTIATTTFVLAGRYPRKQLKLKHPLAVVFLVALLTLAGMTSKTTCLTTEAFVVVVVPSTKPTSFMIRRQQQKYGGSLPSLLEIQKGWRNNYRQSYRGSVPLFSNNNNNNNEEEENNNSNNNNNNMSFLQQRLAQADILEIRSDTTLVVCYVLCRFLIYDITMNPLKQVPGWEVQDWIWITGTLSSACVLAMYWTVAGLLSRSFESNTSSTSTGMEMVLLQTLVTTALCGPIWVATEHLLKFGPTDIGGPSLEIAIGTGFLGLASFMTLTKALTSTLR